LISSDNEKGLENELLKYQGIGDIKIKSHDNCKCPDITVGGENIDSSKLNII
jgi:hypothetical protein